jgi:hypothetical protein
VRRREFITLLGAAPQPQLLARRRKHREELSHDEQCEKVGPAARFEMHERMERNGSDSESL